MFDWILFNTPIFYLTQSLWRDEAFSVLIAERPLSSFVGSLGFEPPLYYILLHIWMKIFGTSEIAIRSLSLLGFFIATYIITLWSEKRFGKHWLSWAIPLLFFLNPMLLYYAFEARAYGWIMAFSAISLYAYGQKKYILTSLANILAFYTHAYTVFIPTTQLLHYVLTHKKINTLFHWRRLVSNNYVRSLFFTGISMLPWILHVSQHVGKLRDTWYYPVDLQTVLSSLGNMLIGYDGTPGGLWTLTTILSLFFLFMIMLALKNIHHRSEILYVILSIIVPLVVVLGVSFIKPMFVHRYLIYVTIAQIMLIGFAIRAIKHHQTQTIVTGIVFLFFVAINIYFPQAKAKLDIRSVVKEATIIQDDNDVIYATSPLIFFETAYYAKDRERVFLYNPEGNPFPWYVGEAAFLESQMAYDLPEYPNRAIMIYPNRSITISYKTATP